MIYMSNPKLFQHRLALFLGRILFFFFPLESLILPDIRHCLCLLSITIFFFFGSEQKGRACRSSAEALKFTSVRFLPVPPLRLTLHEISPDSLFKSVHCYPLLPVLLLLAVNLCFVIPGEKSFAQ